MPWLKLYTTMELVPVPLVPTCATKWVYKAVNFFQTFAFIHEFFERSNMIFPRFLRLDL